MKAKSKKGLTAAQLPSGSWRCRVYDGTLKKQISFTSDDPDEAVMLATQYKLSHQAVSDISKTLGECIDEYINAKSNILSPTTISKYKNIKRSQLSEDFLNIKMKLLKGIDIQNEINRLAGTEYKPGKLYSAKSVYNANGLISAVVSTFRPELRYNVTLPRREKKKKDLPTPEKVIEVFKDTDMELIVLLGMWQGFRVSEIRGLKKTDFKDGILTINRVKVTVDGKQVEKTAAKTEQSKRSLQIPPAIQALVDKVEGDYITTLTGERIYKKFKRKITKAGFPDMTFHDLRHLNASVMLMLGIPDKYAMERGGWSNTATLKNIYQETFSDERQRVDTKIDDYFNDLYTPKKPSLATRLDTHISNAPKKPRKFRLKRI